ncbi:MAG: DNA topoisomerase IB [Sphingobacteriales bacterium]|nr:MAG: DNA topoisomerase IB [Sphingobacteriales bacterium]
MYQRSRKGKGFYYTDNTGQNVTDPKLKDFFKSLVIPPAWEQVTINSSPRAKIQATGYDIKGRKQYIYNPKFRKQQDELKFDRIIRFAKQLEHMRRVTGQHLRKRKLSRDKVLATMVRLLEAAFFRPGNEYYRKANQSFGLTTLRSKHLEIRGNEMIFTFRGKSGQDQEKHIMDARLTRIVQELDELPGYEIFKYIDDDDQLHDIRSNDLNQYIRETMGEEFSAKDFRTWAGTVIAAMALDEIGAVEPEDQKKLKKNIRDAVVTVSEKLGNTPAIARSSYIDPRVINHYTQGRTLANMNRSVKRLLKNNEQLSVEELGVLCLLRKRLGKG